MAVREHGFTLIEMLIALAVSGLLISLVYGSIVIGQRSALSLIDTVDETEVMLISLDFLQRAIGEARPVSSPGSRGDHTGFTGGSESLSFITSLPMYVGQGGLTRITLGVEHFGGRERLLVERAAYPTRSNVGALSSLGRAVLLDNIDALEIHYLGRTRDGQVAWFDEWSDPRFLPNLVRIRIKPTKGPVWPVLIGNPLTGTAPIPKADFYSVQGVAGHGA